MTLPIADEIIDPKRLRYEVTALGRAAVQWDEPITALEIQGLFVQYVPRLTAYGRALGLSGDAECVAIEVLGDVVLKMADTGLAPCSIEPYLLTAMHNRVCNYRRDEKRRTARREAACTEVAPNEWAVVDCHSEFGLLSAQSPDSETSDTRPFVRKLVAMVLRELEDDETDLALSVGNHVPLREIAKDMGISYAAVRVRLYRLRHRLSGLAVECMNGLEGEQRRAAERYFLRAHADT